MALSPTINLKNGHRITIRKITQDIVKRTTDLLQKRGIRMRAGEASYGEQIDFQLELAKAVIEKYEVESGDEYRELSAKEMNTLLADHSSLTNVTVTHAYDLRTDYDSEFVVDSGN